VKYSIRVCVECLLHQVSINSPFKKRMMLGCLHTVVASSNPTQGNNFWSAIFCITLSCLVMLEALLWAYLKPNECYLV